MATQENYGFSKFKHKFTLRPKVGKDENEADVREDEEQSEKLQEIIDLLVAAGYFRARIKTLSPFDRVVGGMTWCIESCNVEVDVDLLFQENLTIGQKIALTEKIVSVLPQIQCPHPIEPHQIQGLDFIHIFPVIQWLVKRSMEFRKDVSNACYSFALNQFDKHFPQNTGFTDKQQQLLQNIQYVNEVYKPHRVLRRKNLVPFKDINSKVQITLLEYGHKATVHTTKDDNEVGDIELHLEGHGLNQIMDNMAVTEEEILDYDALPEKDREKISDHYKRLKQQFHTSNSQSNEIDRVANLKARRDDLIRNLEESYLHKLEIKKEADEIREMITKMKLEQQDIKEAIRELQPDENNLEETKEIERLLQHGDNLEKQMTEFEENCRNELPRLKNSIENAEQKSALLDAKTTEINERIEQQNEKLKVLRLQLAKKNRALSTLLRRIDEVPSRAELAEYQKRFIDLYNQISAKHKETKQYYSLYNMLEDTKQYMKKEQSLLNSIIDNYPQAMRTREGKEEFLQQLSNILDGVQQSKLKLEKRLSQEKRKRDELGDSLHNFMELNRKYATAIKMLKAEFQKNEEFIKQISND